jgi:hypothetical protein
MKYNLHVLETFEKAAKPLQKKYLSFKEDLEVFQKELEQNPDCGSHLGGGIRKIRVAIASKNQGKSGGARIIAYDVYLTVCEKDVYLITIYDKSEKESISKKEIKKLLIKNGFL